MEVYPHLYQVARHVLVMSTQSADVERLCKAHKLIHTTMRNRLKNKTVIDLIYCYVNMRLLNKLGRGSQDAFKDAATRLKHNNKNESNYVVYDDEEETDASALDSFLEQANP